jgi:hypothetical protein
VEALFEGLQQSGALLLGAGLPHDASPMEGLPLVGRRLGVGVRPKLGLGEGPRMVVVCIECGQKRGAFLHDPDPSVTAPMDAPLMPLGLTKPAFKIQVVDRKIGIVAAHEQAGLEAAHGLGERSSNGMIIASKNFRQFVESGRSVLTTPPARVQRLGHLPQLCYVLPDLLLRRLDFRQPPVDASGQPLKLLVQRPPFFASRLRSSEARTSRIAPAMCRPGGSSGPPWSELRIPRTVVQ